MDVNLSRTDSGFKRKRRVDSIEMAKFFPYPVLLLPDRVPSFITTPSFANIWVDHLDRLVYKTVLDSREHLHRTREVDIDKASMTMELRADIIEWISEMGCCINGIPREMLHLAVRYLDVYIAHHPTMIWNVKNSQLVACSCVFIASKLEQDNPIHSEDLIAVTQGVFTKQMLIDTEFELTLQLNFKLLVGTAFAYIDAFAPAFCNSLNIQDYCAFITQTAQSISDVSLTERTHFRYGPSTIAICCLCIAAQSFCRGPAGDFANWLSNGRTTCYTELFHAIKGRIPYPTDPTELHPRTPVPAIIDCH